MTELFDPFFNIQFKCDKDIEEIVSEFQSNFESMMIQRQGHLRQNEDYYFDFHKDPAYKLGLSPYTYELDVAGKHMWEAPIKQEAHKDFARSVVTYFQEQGCLIKFVPLFPIDD